MTISEVLASVEAEGVRLWTDGERIHYRSPIRLGDGLREVVAANKPALIAHLSLWEAAEAIRLECAADGAVSPSGTFGSDPEILTLADACVAAHHRRDMNGVRSNCALIENRVRALSAGQRV